MIPANEQSVAISADGSTLVYALRMPGYHSRGSLYAQSLNDGVSRSLEEFRRRPFFSPDGGHLAVIEGGLTIMSLADGEKETFCEECFKGLGDRSGAGGTWGEDGTIVVAHGKLWRLSAERESPQVVPTPSTEGPDVMYLWPSFLPGGEWVLVTIRRTRTIRGAEIAAVNIETGEQRTVLDDGTNARFVPSGHLVFARDGDLWAAPFDPRALETTGPPALVIEGVAMSESLGEAPFAVSDTGTLAYYPGEMLRVRGHNEVLLYDREGTSRSPFAERLDFRGLRFSPDGTRAALVVREGPDYDIWIYDLEAGTHFVLTSTSADEMAPVWSPNGKRVAFWAYRDGMSEIITLPADGSAVTTPNEPASRPDFIVSGEGMLVPGSWSADGTIAYQAESPEAGWDIWVVSVEDKEPRPFLNTSIDEMFPSFSPDGRWLACNCGGDIRVISYPDKETSFGVGGPGVRPKWGSNGNELYYVWNGLWMVAFDELDGIPQPPRKLDFTTARRTNFDVLPDGRGFGFINRRPATPTTPEIKVVVNWFEELKQRVPTGR